MMQVLPLYFKARICQIYTSPPNPGHNKYCSSEELKKTIVARTMKSHDLLTMCVYGLKGFADIQ